MEYYMDEKWKLSKEDRPHSSSKPSISRSFSTKSSLQKSFSQKNPFGLSRSTSQKSTSSKSSLTRSSSQKCSGFTRKCTNMAKEQKAKFSWHCWAEKQLASCFDPVFLCVRWILGSGRFVSNPKKFSCHPRREKVDEKISQILNVTRFRG